jgi:division protein CdvB (Snf7/Vps24/ESCRT-III family)
MNEAQQKLADSIGELLAESPLDSDVKNLLLDRIEEIPESLLFRLKDALETEKEELESVAFDISIFLKDQDKNWQAVVQEQKNVAAGVTDKWVEKLKV